MKKIRIIISIFITAVLLSYLPASAASDPDIQAAAALLVEQTTGTVLYEKNASERLEPASITKIMTALLAAEAVERGELGLQDPVPVTKSMFFDIETKSSLKLKVGEELPFYDVLACCVIASVNETCNMLAEYISGDAASFVALMNARAAELGCKGTHFSNTHGLPAADHYTTANDVYLIMSAAMEQPLITELESKTTYIVSATAQADQRVINTTNKLLVDDSRYSYPYAVGGKTGHTSAAGYCLASVAEKDDLQLVSVILGAEGIKNEDESVSIMSFIESRRLFKWGFSSFGYRTVLDTSDLICEVPVEMGDGANSVVLRPESPISLYMDLSVPEQDIERKVMLFTDGVLTAPIEAGDLLGRVALVYRGETLGEAVLVANTSVRLMHIEHLKSGVSDFFHAGWVRLMLLAFAIIIILYIIYVVRHNRIRKQKLAEYKSVEPQKTAVGDTRASDKRSTKK